MIAIIISWLLGKSFFLLEFHTIKNQKTDSSPPLTGYRRATPPLLSRKIVYVLVFAQPFLCAIRFHRMGERVGIENEKKCCSNTKTVKRI